MMTKNIVRGLAAGWIGAFVGNGLLGALYSSPWLTAVLYDPDLQSDLFISVTQRRNVAVSVAGLVFLGGLQGLAFAQLNPSLPGKRWFAKGLWWGLWLWALYWLFQEWFIYVTLLDEPLRLAVLELVVLLSGSLLEGLVIAWILVGRTGVGVSD